MIRWVKKLFIKENKLETYFGLSYAAWVVLPRTILQDMPLEWQNRFADMLKDLNYKYPKFPDYIYSVTAKNPKNNLFVKIPREVTDYRHPNKKTLKKWKGENNGRSRSFNIFS